jgi:ABC-type phosphate transport system permease subunit
MLQSGSNRKRYIYILKILIMQFSLSSICLIMFIIAMFVIGSGDRQTDMQVAFKLSEFNFDPTESLNGQIYDVLCSRACFLVFFLNSLIALYTNRM